MSRALGNLEILDLTSFDKFYLPIGKAKCGMPPLVSRGNRPLKTTFDDQLKALIFFHLEEHTSAQHLLQVFEDDDFARNNIAPEEGIKKSSFAEAINTRGLEQLSHIYQNLQTQAIAGLPKEHNDLGDLISIDGSKYWVATDRYDLTAEQIASIYKLRWDVETFFAWWKRHLKVYHLIARSDYGLMVQILAGLITYLLLAIYCREHYNLN